MMKTKIKKKNYLKIGVLLFLSILLINCNNEIEPEVNEKKPNLYFKKISFNTLKKESKKTVHSLNKIAKYNHDYFNLKNNDSNTYYIDSTNIINLSDNNGFTSYTFSVISDLDKPSLQNIIISNYADGTTNTVLVEYALDKILGEILYTIEDNIIERKYYQLDNPILTNTNKSSGFNNYSSCVEIGYYLTRTRNKCEPGDSNPNCVDENGSLIRITTRRFISVAEFCENGGSGGNFTNGNNNTDYPDGWINGGGANGNNSTIPSNIIATSPNNSNTYIKSFLKTNNFLINSPEYIWIEDNPFLTNIFGQTIIAFPNNSSLSIDVLHYLMQNDTLPYSGINFNEIFDYISDNNNSEESLYLAEVTTETIISNPNNNISSLLSYPINDEPSLGDCISTIIKKTMLVEDFSDTSFGSNIKNSFFAPSNRHIFITSAATNNNAAAVTKYNRVPIQQQGLTGETVVMVLSPNYLNNASDIAVVTTVVHELLHAYIINLYHDDLLLITFPQYTDLNTAFNDYVNAPNYPNELLIDSVIKTNLDNKIHDIYIDFIDDLAENILSYATRNGIEVNNSPLSLDYAKSLVWGSLQGNDVFFQCPNPIQANSNFNNEINNYNDGSHKKTCNN